MARLTTIGGELLAGLLPRASDRSATLTSGTSVSGASTAPPDPGRARARLNTSYGLSALIGVLTYLAYGQLNQAWGNLALIAIAMFLFLSTPLYSKISNRLEMAATRLTRLETVGRIARYLLQLLDNLILLWVVLAGGVIDPAGLEAIGGFFATAAWITMVSQGGQYLANWLAQRQIGEADYNVVVAISASAVVSALAVSGVAWIQPVYVAVSLAFGIVVFGVGIVVDVRGVFSRHALRADQP